MESRARFGIDDITRGEFGSGSPLPRFMGGSAKKPAGLIPMVLLFGLLMPAMAMNCDAEDAAPALRVHRITVTAYTKVPGCTDSTPDVTASCLHIRPEHYWKIIALSRDIAKDYSYGDRFELRIGGKSHVVEFQDLMPAKHTRKIDLLLPSVRKCKAFGKREGILIPLSMPGKHKSAPAG
jgi:3D (Asp-Asp-Asp) domain-containing protein